ncbi:MAG: hypothetical protein AB1556_10555 [Bacillota bacterium]
MSQNFNPLVVPALLLLSLTPESEKKLGQLAAVVEATQSAVQALRSGLDGFYNTLMEALIAPGYGKSPDVQKTPGNFSTKPAQGNSGGSA